jgi:PAS domain-containing protein
MTLNILRLPRLIAERRSTAILGMLIIGMLWAGIAFRHFNGIETDLQLHAIATLLTLIILAAMERLLRAEAKAHQKAEQLRLTLEHMNQGIMLVTPDQEIPIINRRCVELLDLPPRMI